MSRPDVALAQGESSESSKGGETTGEEGGPAESTDAPPADAPAGAEGTEDEGASAGSQPEPDDRWVPPLSLEDDLGYEWQRLNAPAADAAADGGELTVPVQEPVPEPPGGDAAAAVTAEGTNRRTRLLDVGTDLPTRIARDGGFAYLPRWGGLAGDVMAYGSPGTMGSDLSVTLNGLPYGIPVSGRGIHYTDLRLIPLSALDGYTIHRGGGYGGAASLQTRKLHGADAAILYGERDRRYISVSGGVVLEGGSAIVALESRTHRGLKQRTNEDLMTMLGRVELEVTPELALGLNLRFYRDVWDEVGTLVTEPAVCDDPFEPCDDIRIFSAGVTDGGDLRGTGGSLDLRWRASERTEVSAAFGYLDDRFNLYRTEAPELDAAGEPTGEGQQVELRDYSRVAYATALLTFAPGWETLSFVETLGAGGEIGYTNAQTDTFLTAERERIFQRDDLEGDWVKTGVDVRAGLRFFQHLTVHALAGFDTVSLRRTEPRLGVDAEDELAIAAVFDVAIGWDADVWGLSLRLLHDARTAPDAFMGGVALGSVRGPLVFEMDRVQLTGTGRYIELQDWRISGYAGVYGASYGRSVLNDPDGIDPGVLVIGGDIGLDVAHLPTQIALVARGGPTVSSLPDGDSWGAEAPGVTLYAVHVGVIRRGEGDGLMAEAWLDAYGDYVLADGTGPGGAQQNVSLRVGYRVGPAGLWIGVDNLLDGAVSSPPDQIVRRADRSFYAMLDLAP